MGKKLLISALMLLLAVPVFAQSNTAGALAGDVKDASGGALPGVTVELSGPAMQGTRTAVTDTSGHYRFVNVPPGENYKVAATLSGFQPQTKNVQRVFLGQEGTVDFTLRAAVSEAITVTAEAPLVDVSHTTTGVNVTNRQFESLPTSRTFQQLTTMAPGVNMDMSNSRNAQLGNSPQVGASSAPENNYIIDGLSTTDVREGTSGTNLTMNFVEEVQVMTGGYSAEYGRSTGGVFNVITKSGGNDLHGDVFGYYSGKSWTSQDEAIARRGTTVESSQTESKDAGISVGGPIMKDRLWYFGAFNPSRRTVNLGSWNPPLGDQPTDYKVRTNFYAGKLTFAATPNHNFVVTAFGDPTREEGWLIRGVNTTPALASSATRKDNIGSNNANLRYTGVLTQSFLAELNAGRHQRNNDLGPGTVLGASVPRQIDETNSSMQMGGFQRNVNEKGTRDAWSGKLTNYLGKHELRYGLDFEQNKYVADTHETWYRYFGAIKTSRFVGACAGQTCDQVQERIYSVDGAGKTNNNAAFLQDQWKVTDNLQFSLGVRYEEQKMSSARGVYLASNPDQASDPSTAKHVGSYTMKNNWAPRLGVIFDPMRDGRSKLYAYAGRFFEAVPLDLNIRALNGEDYIINDYQHPLSSTPLYWYNPTGNPIPDPVRAAGRNGATVGGWSKYRIRDLEGTSVITPLASDLKAQYQDEFILGGERQFANVWSAGVRLVDRELKRVIEDFGVFAPDPSDPTGPEALVGYAIGNPSQGALGGGATGNPFPRPRRYYRAAEFTVQRAFRDNWQLYASYVYARARGNYEGLFVTGYEQLDPNITALYDLPAFLNNSYGKLRADKPMNFKIHSSYMFPFGLTVSEGFYLSSGVPISALAPDIEQGYGDGTIFLTPRGSMGRTPTYYNLDLHGDYSLPFFNNGGRKLSAIIDIFNVTNAHKPLEVDTDYVYQGIESQQGAAYAPWFEDANLDANGEPLFNANLPASRFFGTPRVYQAPRSFQVGLRFTY
jgi:Carboxypeptidase regulatory-like domain/TonB dependent receptor/TonB-dependent Receptor Plug Domain